ncbi:Nudix hydrolase 14 [Gluconacetobacter sp. SXCC-1]|uniref:GDP-mannose pyrophosphatase n=1 Tax=Komagataeibacter rhaeticus TaxID=215221 RepID=A0A181CAA5_9PROT|nr:NUDIX domain-containing protein [Komagataeibacter rhaeticus]ATU72962.1 NUDIX domain-containing protein [Komagataeibacter xylinus]EGG77263.1 Nudix hydrolase 14 [Gluconacetobacter sp. SXCC-1]QIP35290.1 NUDIX domain-containing protein [Komagataeibacter rhaeticus]QOC47853.1 NUDIX domain-containing protein [Komagataeibacter rhaeticus]WPP22770.1 NUDIX domain-containing protein [Komagataeibacter rhaeticus]
MDDTADISFAPGMDPALRARVLAAPHFRRWHDGMRARFTLRHVLVRDAVAFGPTRMGFILVEADALHQGQRVPGLALLRGDSVSVLLVLKCPGYPDRTVLTCEARVPVARPDLLALPAGMLDGGAFESTALRELSEEVGADLRVRAQDLVALTRVWLSPGGCDEAIGLYYAELDIDEGLARRLSDRQTGLAREHEHIRLHVIDLDQIPHIGMTDAKTLLSWHLYQAR